MESISKSVPAAGIVVEVVEVKEVEAKDEETSCSPGCLLRCSFPLFT